MSDPYSPYPSGNEPNGYSPYPGAPGGPGGPYGAMPYGAPVRSHTTRNILIGVAVAIVLVCGGLITGVAVLVGKTSSAISSYDEYPGGPKQPITVTMGQAFSIHGIDYAEGWKLNGTEDGYSDRITGLSATNNRPNKTERTISIEFTFRKGNNVLEQIDCNGNSLRFNDATALTCYSSDVPKGYDSIQVNDSIGDYSWDD